MNTSSKKRRKKSNALHKFAIVAVAPLLLCAGLIASSAAYANTNGNAGIKPGTLSVAPPSSLAWSTTLNGFNQNLVDSNGADQGFQVNDSTGSGAGWHVTAAATTFTARSGAANTVTATVAVETNPSGAAVNASTNMVYVSNHYSDTVSVINGATNTVTATVSVGSSPEGVAVDSATNMIYVANNGSSTVSVINGTTNTVTATVAVGSGPDGVAVDSATNMIYVANWASASMSVINGATNTVTDTITVGRTPMGVAVDSATNMIYVANNGSSTVSVINGATNAVTGSVTIAGESPSVYGLGVNTSTNTIYVTFWQSAGVSIIGGGVSAINGATNAVTATVGVEYEPEGMGVNPATNTVYVSNYDSSTVSVINSGTPPHTLANAGTFSLTGSISSDISTATPSVSCVHGHCILPTPSTSVVYPVAITTASSSPTAVTLYSAEANTGRGNIQVGGSTATDPVGWWLYVPANTYAGTYTSTITIDVVSGP